MSADVRFASLLRDPVARLRSLARIIARARGTAIGSGLKSRVEAILGRAFGVGAVQVMRGDGDRALAARPRFGFVEAGLGRLPGAREANRVGM